MPNESARFRSRLIFQAGLPDPEKLGEYPVLIHDRVLAEKVPGFRSWSKRFPLRFAVTAGEELKSLASFSRFIEVLIGKTARIPSNRLTIVAAGGGSVGDFAGFVASVFKRGVELVHIPSTWLAALDSAHGGKTALNVGGAKNQIGTFHPASRIYLVRRLLSAQSAARMHDAFAELAKIGLIDGRPWFDAMMRARLEGEALLWKFLP